MLQAVADPTVEEILMIVNNGGFKVAAEVFLSFASWFIYVEIALILSSKIADWIRFRIQCSEDYERFMTYEKCAIYVYATLISLSILLNMIKFLVSVSFILVIPNETMVY